jgi:putative nucleotidyltransferase with HDIG domain
LDVLFIPYFRAKFVDMVATRFAAYGLGGGSRPGMPAGDSENAVRESLELICSAAVAALEADEIVVALFSDQDRSSYIAGSSLGNGDAGKSALMGDIDRVVANGFSPPVGGAIHVEYVDDGADAAPGGGALFLPVYIDGAIGGILAAAKDEGGEFTPFEESRLRLASVLFGACAQEIASQSRSEERLRSLAHGLSAALDARDPKTRGHTHRVAMYAMAIVNEMDCDDSDPEYRELRNRIRLGALLHDVGKIGIPDEILLKPDKLTDEEYDVIKRHSVMGAEIVTECYGFKDLVPGVLYHHEHMDGSGYPFGLSGDRIPLMARIVAVADAFDAITSDRPFRSASSHEEGIRILTEEVAHYYDPVVLEALVRAHRKGALEYVRVPAKSVHVGEDPNEGVERIYGRQLKSIPSLPHVLSTVNSLLSDPASSLREIAKVLSTDEGLASRVLKLVNSAYYGLPRMVSTIPLATTILGSKAIKNHVINIAYADLMGALGGGHREYDILWRHALKTAAWARAICTDSGHADPEEAFTAGLVHDIGKALSLRLKPTDYGRLIVEAERSGRALTGVEQEVIGFDHNQMGAWAATRWQLPETLVSSIRWHHEPSWMGDAPEDLAGLVRVIHIADIAARASQTELGGFSAFLLKELSPQVLGDYGSEYFMDLESMSEQVEEAEKQLEETFAETSAAAG